MNAKRLLILAGLLAILLPLKAMAEPDRPCVVDPMTGMPVAENGSGACFGDSGFTLILVNEDDGLLFAQNTSDDNQWFRRNPNGRGKLHASVDVPYLAYCSPATLEAGACDPFSGEAFEGIGTVQLNTSLDGGFFDCPLTARVNGVAVDGSGNTIEVQGALTLVPDDAEGCRATVDRIDVSVVAD